MERMKERRRYSKERWLRREVEGKKDRNFRHTAVRQGRAWPGMCLDAGEEGWEEEEEEKRARQTKREREGEGEGEEPERAGSGGERERERDRWYGAVTAKSRLAAGDGS
jgi:hypothetical protein